MLLNEFKSHLLQEEAPADAANVPSTHFVHDVAPAPDEVPATQLVHEAVAVAALYVPLAHSVQDDAAAPEYVPVGHAEHDVARPLL